VVEKHLGVCPFRKLRKWEDNLKMNISGTVSEDWWHMELAQNNVQ
jgi:hypothetical protein